jgi:hypothetical protein
MKNFAMMKLRAGESIASIWPIIPWPIRTIHQEGDGVARSLVEKQIRMYSCPDS